MAEDGVEAAQEEGLGEVVVDSEDVVDSEEEEAAEEDLEVAAEEDLEVAEEAGEVSGAADNKQS